MIFRSFYIRIFIRLILLTFSIWIITVLVIKGNYFSAAILFLILAGQLSELIYFLNSTNRKLTRFLESVKYADFTTSYRADNQLGRSFRDLNQAFNQVIEAFRQTREKSEESLLYLDTVVQHVHTGLISFDTKGKIQLINTRAKKLIQSFHLNNIHDLASDEPAIHKLLSEIRPGQNTSIRLSDDLHLSIHATEIKISGVAYKLVSLQNIQNELQKKELEAWQNLTRVLRHEIMNSITPISSLTSTMESILKEDMRPQDDQFLLHADTKEDLEDGLVTIKNRSKGLIRFVNAYRDYTNIPEPKFKLLKVDELFDRVVKLNKAEIERNKVDFNVKVLKDNLEVLGDDELIEMVLINLVKNAIEAVDKKSDKQVTLSAGIHHDQRVEINVSDNGPGILQEAQERIFIPFFTTKKTGSGIGLALSRQIMQLHGGSLNVHSKPEELTVFSMRF